METVTQRWTLGELAALLGAELHGPQDLPISGPADAQSTEPGGLAFAENEEYLRTAEQSAASALLLPTGFSSDQKPFLTVASPRSAFAQLLSLAYRPMPSSTGVHPTAVVADGVRVPATAWIGPYAVIEKEVTIGENVKIFPFCYVGENCQLGDRTQLMPHAVLYRDVSLGHDCIVHSGAVLGADGFGFVWDGEKQQRVPQAGTVEMGCEVEIGALTAVDRATISKTVIGDGVKLDNLIQIGHNVTIGKHTVIASQTGVSGSTTIGDRVAMGGQCAISDHVRIGDDIQLGGRTGVGSDLMEPGAYLGTPAIPISEGLRALLLSAKLPDFFKRLRAVERKLEEK